MVMNLSASVRNDSYKSLLPSIGPRQREILEYFYKHPDGLTAFEVKYEMDKFTGRYDVNGDERNPIYQIRPRITELCKMGYLEPCGVRWHEATKRNETAWVKTMEFTFDTDGQAIWV